MMGDIIPECRATSNRNGERDHFGIVGDIDRNQHGGEETDISTLKEWAVDRQHTQAVLCNASSV
jgi:hypothetical protein